MKFDKRHQLYNADSLKMLLTVSKLSSESTAREFISLSHLFMSRLNFVLHSVIQIVTTANSALIYSNKERFKQRTTNAGCIQTTTLLYSATGNAVKCGIEQYIISLHWHAKFGLDQGRGGYRSSELVYFG